MTAVTSLETLYREVGPSVLAYLQRLAGDLHAAEDLLQETFFQAARREDRLGTAVSPRAWVFTIARNVAITALRRRRKTSPLPVELPGPRAAEDPRLDAMRDAIGDLPASMRETLELRLRDELTYEEIAAVLEIPIGTVRSRLHHVVRHLRATVVAGAT